MLESGALLPYTPFMFHDGANISWDNRRIRSENVSFGEVRYNPGGYCGPRVQRDYELVILHSGSCHVRVDDCDHKLEVGWAALFCPGRREHFRFSAEAQTHHTWCAIRVDFIEPQAKQRLLEAPFAAQCSEIFKMLHAAAFRVRVPPSESSRALIDQLGLSLVSAYLDMAASDPASAHDPAVHRVVRYMEEHFGDEACLAEANRLSGISRNALIYKFRAELKTTPSRYLWRLRTERGIAMLSDTGLTVAEIAYRCGFKNPFHFSRLVRDLQGHAPRTVRQNAWTDASPVPKGSVL